MNCSWYEFRGFFVRRNERTGKRAPGGYAYEVDVLAYDPRTRELHHLEVSGSAASWADLKRQTVRKFLASKEEFSNDEARITNKARMTNHKRCR
jgi:hypothetical protein